MVAILVIGRDMQQFAFIQGTGIIALRARLPHNRAQPMCNDLSIEFF